MFVFFDKLLVCQLNSCNLFPFFCSWVAFHVVQCLILPAQPLHEGGFPSSVPPASRALSFFA